MKVDEGCVLAVCGHDDAIIGMLNGVIAYSTQKIVDGLMKQGMSEEEALEFFEYNIAGSHLRPKNMPVFVEDLGLAQEE